jgi:hypothetical protein
MCVRNAHTHAHAFRNPAGRCRAVETVLAGLRRGENCLARMARVRHNHRAAQINDHRILRRLRIARFPHVIHVSLFLHHVPVTNADSIVLSVPWFHFRNARTQGGLSRTAILKGQFSSTRHDGPINDVVLESCRPLKMSFAKHRSSSSLLLLHRNELHTCAVRNGPLSCCNPFNNSASEQDQPSRPSFPISFLRRASPRRSSLKRLTMFLMRLTQISRDVRERCMACISRGVVPDSGQIFSHLRQLGEA